MINIFGAQSETVEKVRGLDEFLRKQYTRQALDLIATELRAEDLALVRDVMRSGFVDYSSADLQYLKRFGAWEDIPCIIASLDRASSRRGTSLLGIVSDERYQLPAATVTYTLGKDESMNC
ncbi:MAG: hypothetical protein IPO57_02690 [Rhodocyclales bacterium]|nr:hypothetical protein [Rhodocyclales bacterium]